MIEPLLWKRSAEGWWFTCQVLSKEKCWFSLGGNVANITSFTIYSICLPPTNYSLICWLVGWLVNASSICYFYDPTSYRTTNKNPGSMPVKTHAQLLDPSQSSKVGSVEGFLGRKIPGSTEVWEKHASQSWILIDTHYQNISKLRLMVCKWMISSTCTNQPGCIGVNPRLSWTFK